MVPVLYLACAAADYDSVTGACAAPFYAMPPAMIPHMSIETGLAWTAAIAGCWAVGVVGRVMIRTGHDVKR